MYFSYQYWYDDREVTVTFFGTWHGYNKDFKKIAITDHMGKRTLKQSEVHQCFFDWRKEIEANIKQGGIEHVHMVSANIIR